MNRAFSTLALTATAAMAILIVQATTIVAQTPPTAPGPSLAQKKYQAKPPATQPFGAKAFEASDRTTIRWTGNAGFFIIERLAS